MAGTGPDRPAGRPKADAVGHPLGAEPGSRAERLVQVGQQLLAARGAEERIVRRWRGAARTTHRHRLPHRPAHWLPHHRHVAPLTSPSSCRRRCRSRVAHRPASDRHVPEALSQTPARSNVFQRTSRAQVAPVRLSRDGGRTFAAHTLPDGPAPADLVELYLARAVNEKLAPSPPGWGFPTITLYTHPDRAEAEKHPMVGLDGLTLCSRPPALPGSDARCVRPRGGQDPDPLRRPARAEAVRPGPLGAERLVRLGEVTRRRRVLDGVERRELVVLEDRSLALADGGGLR
jgi:hypothetical protein